MADGSHKEHAGALIRQALHSYHAGHLADAEALFRRILAQDEGHADALHLYGCLVDDLGRTDEAIRLVGRAIERNGSAYAYRYNLANMLSKQGRWSEAIAHYRSAIHLKPDYAIAYNNLGLALAAQGDGAGAKDCYREAIRLRADYPNPHYNLGIELRKEGDLAGAIRAYREAIRIRPEYPDALYNLGNAYSVAGRLDEAVAAYREAARISPANPRIHTSLGAVLQRLGMPADAAASFGVAVRLDPSSDAWFNLGNAYSASQCLEEAVAAYREAARLDPDNPQITINLGAALQKMGLLDEAAASFREALRLDPANVANHSNLILLASYTSDDPADMRAACDEWGRLPCVAQRDGTAPHANQPNDGRRLRIGYVSADFRCHAAASWIEPVLAGHRHDAYEIFCYSNSPIADEVTARLRAHADAWVECAQLDDAALDARIRSDGIDILVDLSGHTDGNRLLVFARQPAPVQVGWFGFPGSTGLTSMHYRLTDGIMDPLGESDVFYTEKLVRLPRFYASFRPEPATPEPGEGPALRNGFVTFASLNNLAKINPAMLEVWAAILRAAPGSRLLFHSAGLDGPELGDRIRKFFAAQGVAANRLTLRGWRSLDEFLAVGAEADIALDPFPFNGGVTTCHSLWMGMPVVTVSGRSAASRVGKSIMSNIGLADLAADSLAHYQAIAVSLAQDGKRLAELRASLRERLAAGGLLDGAGLAKEVENAYRLMWRQWCANAKA